MAITRLNSLAIPADTVVAADIADGSITAAKLASDAASPNPNLIINGDMAIAQRGTSSTSSGINTVDRWNALWTGGGITQSQVALTSGGAYDEGHRHAFKMAVTSTNSANNRYAQMRYIPEAKDIRNFGWQYTSGSSYITVSFWAKSSLAGTYFLSFDGPDSGNAQVYSTPFTLSADTWTKVTKTISGGSNIVLNDDTGIGFYIDIRLDLGTDYTASDATINAWADRSTSYSKTTTDFAQSWQNTANATWELTGVKLEVGQSATTFEKPDYTTELKKCFRYYEKITNATGFSMLGNASSTNTAYFDLYYERKRAAPSFVLPTASVTGSGVVPLTAGGGYPSDSTGTLTALRIGKTSCRLDAENFAGLTSESPSWLYWVQQANNSIEISAEL